MKTYRGVDVYIHIDKIVYLYILIYVITFKKYILMNRHTLWDKIPPLVSQLEYV
jgi:hypothetical protein